MIFYQNFIEQEVSKMKNLGSFWVSSPAAQILAKKIVRDKLMHWKHQNWSVCLTKG